MGSLDRELSHNRGFKEEDCKMFLAQVLLGLEVMHKNGIIHRVLFNSYFHCRISSARTFSELGTIK